MTVRTKLFRWKAIVPLSILLGLLTAAWVLYLDIAIEKSIERIGTTLVGARVDLESAHVRLAQGAVELRGLAVTNPSSPLTNLFEVEQIVANIAILPLLERKIVVETLAVRGVRFGTARETSGAIQQSGESGLIGRQVSDWADGVQVPPFSLSAPGSVQNLRQIDPGELSSVAAALGIRSTVDSMRERWGRQLATLNPGPRIDSARALLERLEGVNLLRLGVTGLAGAANSLRLNISGINETVNGVSQLERAVTGGVSGLRDRLAQLDRLRRDDLSYAMNLLNLPSLDAPDLSPTVFNRAIARRMQPILYWMSIAERYMPPGLDPRRRPGPKRTRLAGTTVAFAEPSSYPRFLLEFAHATVQIGGEGAAAGNYTAMITGLTSDPDIYGSPARFEARREGATRNLRELGIRAVLNHVGENMIDSVNVRVVGVPLPQLELPLAGARLALGDGRSEWSLVRRGDSLSGNIRLRSQDLVWSRSESADGGTTENFLWGVLSSIQTLDVRVSVSGSVTSPRIRVSSNLGRELAAGLRRRLGREIAAAERRVRERVDQLIEEPIADARGSVSNLTTGVQARIAERRSELDDLKTRLEQRLRQLTGGILGIGR